MKKKLFIIPLLIILCTLLAGCQCRHEWVEADCTTAKTCSRCNETEGEALGHAWEDATCETAKTCSRCGLTQGEALGHDWQEATCESAETCANCQKQNGEPLGHRLHGGDIEITEDGQVTYTGTCTVCGSQDVSVIYQDVDDFANHVILGKWCCVGTIMDGVSYDVSDDVIDKVWVEFHEDGTAISTLFDGVMKWNWHFDRLESRPIVGRSDFMYFLVYRIDVELNGEVYSNNTAQLQIVYNADRLFVKDVTSVVSYDSVDVL